VSTSLLCGQREQWGQSHQLQQLGNLLSLCREFAGARDILQKFKKKHE
jgi:hypothetical protein